MSDFNDKVAVITGGNSGIGMETARELVGAGASVVIFGRNGATLDEAATELGERALAVQGDVRKLDDLDRLFDETARRYGHIDTLVVNAGLGQMRPFDATDEETFDLQSDVNFKGAFFTVQKALPLLRDGGSVVLISSVANVKGFPGLSVYNATKAAVRSLARTLAAELAPRGIRVNSISPGPVETPIFTRMGLPEGSDEQAKAEFSSLAPLQRMGRPAEIAALARFLASSDASYITGADVPADGGLAQV